MQTEYQYVPHVEIWKAFDWQISQRNTTLPSRRYIHYVALERYVHAFIINVCRMWKNRENKTYMYNTTEAFTQKYTESSYKV
jgi:hypothetical protein